MPGRDALHEKQLLQESQVLPRRETVQAEPSPEVRDVDQLSRKNGGQPEQSGHGLDMTDSRQIRHIPLDEGVHILPIPGRRPALARP